MGWTFGGEYDAGAAYADPPYFVPHDALLATQARRSASAARRICSAASCRMRSSRPRRSRIRCVGRDAAAPDGWSHAFAARVGDAVLRGYTTFSRADARRAAAALLREGPVRIKCVRASAAPASTSRETRRKSTRRSPRSTRASSRTRRDVEENLADVMTFSVGCVECGGEAIAYCGTQRTTRNRAVTTCTAARRSTSCAAASPRCSQASCRPTAAAAVELARAYDDAAFAHLPRGVRVAAQLRRAVRPRRRRPPHVPACSSSRGASAARAAPRWSRSARSARRRSRSSVRCATVEIYDDACPVPAGAFVYFRGVDAHVGPLTKYAVELDDDDA